MKVIVRECKDGGACRKRLFMKCFQTRLKFAAIFALGVSQNEAIPTILLRKTRQIS